MRKTVHVIMCPFGIFCKPSLCFLNIVFCNDCGCSHVDSKHDKYIDINGSGAAPYKVSWCITYVVLLGFFPEVILQNGSIYCPWLLGRYGCSKLQQGKEHFCYLSHMVCVYSSKVSSPGSYRYFIKPASLSISYKSNINYSLLANYKPMVEYFMY